jgi:hypothetical protein
VAPPPGAPPPPAPYLCHAVGRIFRVFLTHF